MSSRDPEAADAKTMSQPSALLKFVGVFAVMTTTIGAFWLLRVAAGLVLYIPELTVLAAFLGAVALTVAAVSASACLHGDVGRAAALVSHLVSTLDRRSPGRRGYVSSRLLRSAAGYFRNCGLAAAWIAICFLVFFAIGASRDDPTNMVSLTAFFLCMAESGITTIRVAGAMEARLRLT